jgi:hypothetical protein
MKSRNSKASRIALRIWSNPIIVASPTRLR